MRIKYLCTSVSKTFTSQDYFMHRNILQIASEETGNNLKLNNTQTLELTQYSYDCFFEPGKHYFIEFKEAE